MVYELWHVIAVAIIAGIIGWFLHLVFSHDRLHDQESKLKSKLAYMEGEDVDVLSPQLDDNRMKIDQVNIKSNQDEILLQENHKKINSEVSKTQIASLDSLKEDSNGDIEMIEGIGPAYGKKLRSIGISLVKELLEYGGSANGRQQIGEKTGLRHRQILKWVNAADLLRITGMTPDWAELLEASGVDTTKELRIRIAKNLYEKIEEVNPTNPQGSYARTIPDLSTVQNWIEQAKTLDPKITY